MILAAKKVFVRNFALCRTQFLTVADKLVVVFVSR